MSRRQISRQAQVVSSVTTDKAKTERVNNGGHLRHPTGLWLGVHLLEEGVEVLQDIARLVLAPRHVKSLDEIEVSAVGVELSLPSDGL